MYHVSGNDVPELMLPGAHSVADRPQSFIVILFRPDRLPIFSQVLELLIVALQLVSENVANCESEVAAVVFILEIYARGRSIPQDTIEPSKQDAVAAETTALALWPVVLLAK